MINCEKATIHVTTHPPQLAVELNSIHMLNQTRIFSKDLLALPFRWLCQFNSSVINCQIGK